MRECDGCTMCCTYLEVPDVTEKGQTCKHDCHIGCNIHAAKPSVCEKFECAWLQGRIGEEFKPTSVGWFVKVVNGTVDTGMAFGDKTEGQADAVTKGLVIVSQDGRLHAADEEDRALYTQGNDTIAVLRRLIRMRGSTSHVDVNYHYGGQ